MYLSMWIHLKSIYYENGELSQWIKHLLCKSKDMGSTSSNNVNMHAYILMGSVMSALYLH